MSTLGKTAFDWQIHGDRVSALNQLRSRRSLIDAVVESDDGGQEPVHIAIISGLGDHITNLMHEQMDEVETPLTEVVDDLGHRTQVKCLRIPGITRKTLHTFVELAYTGKLDEHHDIYEVLAAAELYRINYLVMTCCAVIARTVTTNNCIDLLHLGVRLNHGKLRYAALKTIKGNLHVVSNCPNFHTLTYKQLKAVLEADDLNVISEECVWTTIARWIESRESHAFFLEALMRSVRYFRMPASAFRRLREDRLVVNNVQAKELVQSWVHERERCTFNWDGYDLPCGVFPREARPRIPQDFLLAYGGWHSGIPTSAIETFDISTNTWSTFDNAMGPQKAYCGIEVYKGEVYTVGGTNGNGILNTLDRYSPGTRTWTSLSELAQSRCYTSTAVLGDKLYAIGGHTGEIRIRTVEIYDFESDTWTAGIDMNVARSDGSAAIMNGKIYVVGGLNEGQIEDTAEVFDPETNTWTMIKAMSSPRTSLSSVVYNNYLYAIGGNSGDERLETSEKYDPTTNSWSPLPNMHSKRSTFDAQEINGRIYAVGGYNGSNPISLVEYYDTATNEWHNAASLQYERSGLALINLRGLSCVRSYTYHGQTHSSVNGDDNDDHASPENEIPLIEIDD